MFNPSKRIVVESYTGFFDDELDEILDLIKEKISQLELPDRIKKTIVVRIDKDSFFEEQTNEKY